MYCTKCNRELEYHDATVKMTKDGWQLLQVKTQEGFCPRCDEWTIAANKPINDDRQFFDVLYKHTQLRTVMVRAVSEEEAKDMVENMDESTLFNATYLSTEDPLVLEVTKVN